MQRVEWRDRLTIGVEFLDRQHEEIIELLNQMIDRFNEGQGNFGVRRGFRQLLDATYTHFSYEESFMLHYGYPGYETHRELHREFMVKAEEFGEVVRQERGQLPEWLLILMRSWYVDHMTGADRDYREFILGRAEQGG